MRRVVMTVKHYQWLLTAAPAISYKEQEALKKFIPRLTPIAHAVRRI
jgi:hypothetical protein